MYDDRKSRLKMVETYADMLLNFLSAWIAYMFVCMIHDPVIKINDPIPMVVIFALASAII